MAFLDSFFLAQVTKLGINVGLNMLINKSPGFCHFRKKSFGEGFLDFPTAKCKPW